MRLLASLGVGLAALTLACTPPDRGAGLYVEHPGDWGADLVTIHHGTFSDTHRNIRIRSEPITAAGLLVAHLEYPTSGKQNREIDALLDEHLEFLITYLHDHPEAKVVLAGFSQGGCIELDVLTRLAQRELALIERASLLLVAPAREVVLGKHSAVARRMVTRCTEAETELETMVEQQPEGPIAQLLGARTLLTWSCNDPIVGHDSFTSLATHIPAEHQLYRPRLGHTPWAAKRHESEDPNAPYGEAVYLASALAVVLAQGLDPHAALSAYVEFDASCS